MTTESYVQVAPDSTGKKVSTTEVTQSDGETTVEVQDVVAKAEVNDAPSAYLPGEIAALSLTTDGRLRVTTVVAATHLNFFGPFSSVHETNPWSVPNPWGL